MAVNQISLCSTKIELHRKVNKSLKKIGLTLTTYSYEQFEYFG